jgi:hypothetical protein
MPENRSKSMETDITFRGLGYEIGSDIVDSD